MRVEPRRYALHVIPENDVERGYLEALLELPSAGCMAVAVRRDGDVKTEGDYYSHRDFHHLEVVRRPAEPETWPDSEDGSL